MKEMGNPFSVNIDEEGRTEQEVERERLLAYHRMMEREKLLDGHIITSSRVISCMLFNIVLCRLLLLGTTSTACHITVNQSFLPI